MTTTTFQSWLVQNEVQAPITSRSTLQCLTFILKRFNTPPQILTDLPAGANFDFATLQLTWNIQNTDPVQIE